MAARDLLSEIAQDLRSKVVQFDKHLYATLDWEPPESTRNGPAELPECAPVPDGWELSSDTAEVAESVAALHPWGTSLLVTRTGAGFTTSGWIGQAGSKISNYELVCVGGNTYAPRRALPSRPSRVLIRYPAGIDPDMPPIVAGPPSFQPEDLSEMASPKVGAAPAPRSSTAPDGAPTEPQRPPLPVAFLFPGQGSQYVGMLKALKDLPAVAEMLSKAKGILGYDLLDLCLKGPEAKLEETRYCQPAIFVAGLAGLEKLRGEQEDTVNRASAMAGLSLGEYTALCAAGVMTFEDGLRLVQLRGAAMQEAAEIGEQLMLSVAGLDEDKLEALCKEAESKADSPDSVCRIANHLFPQGFSVGGTEKAIMLLKELAEKEGALQAKVLKTSGAFHTPLMQPAQDHLAAALDEVLPNMKPPKHVVWMNASAEPMEPGCNPEAIVSLLKRQLTNPVLWETCIRNMIEDGITDFFEVGPMKQIKAMMKRISPEAWKKTTNVEV
mmetsp:Transcript_5615/g.14963  ORF Transcript_5615/g.14963 Transcript_5615/m.14963 type:complete len:496 (-) Transcript_5615:199-1686(-)